MVKKIYTKLKNLYEKYERVLIPGALVFGIIVDAITFASIEVSTVFMILAGHVILSGFIIAFLNAYDEGKIKKENRILKYLRLISPLIIQFTFGALLSAAFIFYVFSGSIWVSWPFILVIVILMISNDVFRKYYLRAKVQIGVYFFLLFSISAIVLPFILQRLGTWIFLLAGVFSLFIIFGYIKILSRYVSQEKFRIGNFGRVIASIFIFVNLLYFLNIIPPIPLSLKEAKVAHAVNRSGNEYKIDIEGESFLEKLIPGIIFHKVPGGEVFVYTAIFAPGSLEANIYHHWQYKEGDRWISKGRFPYPISGGRDKGFRGYSIKRSVPEGKWRVDVETERGQVLGRVSFKVVEVDELPQLLQIDR